MEFIVATIPTVLALQESSRLVKALKKENVPVSTIIVNQIVTEGMGSAYLKLKLKEQAYAMKMLETSPHLSPLEVIKGKLLDLEVRGVPALQYVAMDIWAGMPLPAAGKGEGLVAASASLPWVLNVDD
jgi:arsenite/tail-anchored protein-transporting ATPase